jgi:2-(1,2-epoxy-1,2-dihydrophenyl)acetyl-CoA isomerase
MASERHAGLEIERRDDGVAVIRLARPQRRNAIDGETAVALTTLLHEANTDRELRALVVTGVEGTFCTGADVVSDPDAPKPSTIDYRYATEDFRHLAQALWEVEKPVVSAVNGTVAGFGWTLALLGDLVVADRDARWTHVFARRGMGPYAGEPYFLALHHRGQHASRSGEALTSRSSASACASCTARSRPVS